jgi:hypothetical protein
MDLQQRNRKVGNIFLWLCLLILLSQSAYVAEERKPLTVDFQSASDPLTIPSLSDWDAGQLAFSSGADGEWDNILWGGFANSLIKKGDIYYLYYQGSPFYDDECESVAYRAIGVATSTDGIHWVKSDNNPVITWSSQGSIEEGAVSSAAWLGSDGKIYIYYGANTSSDCNVEANARLAVSEDGENFQDLGQVLSASDPDVWGAGDEIFPVGAYSYQDQWYLYYIPNGVSLARKLGVASGGSPTSFTQTTGLNNSAIPAWGPVSVILNGTDSVLVTNPLGFDGPLNIYKFDAGDPAAVQLHDSYALPDCSQVSVIYESSLEQWMMSCRDQNAENYYVRTARFTTFADVPSSHPYYEDIEILYANGLTAGCVTSPPKFCPDQIMDRAQSAVFMLRGSLGVDYAPPEDASHLFADDWSPGLWAEKWAEGMYLEGLTAGCLASPLKFCPWDLTPREQAAIFGLRLKYGNDYDPPPATGTLFADMTDVNYYATRWAEQAYLDGLIPSCGTSGGKPRFCPRELVTRGLGAYIIVRAKNLSMP